MRNCEEYKLMINEYLDNELDSELLSEFLLHMENCNTCKDELEEVSHYVNLVKDIPQEELPLDFKVNLHSKLTEEKKILDKQSKVISIRNKYIKILSSVAAILIIALISKGIFMKQTSMNSSSDTAIAPFAASAPLEDNKASQKSNITENAANKELSRAASGTIGSAAEKAVPKVAFSEDKDAILNNATAVNGVRSINNKEISLKVESPDNEFEKVKSELLENGAKLLPVSEIKLTVQYSLKAAPAMKEEQRKIKFYIPKDNFSTVLNDLYSSWGNDVVTVKEITTINENEEIDILNNQINDLNTQIKSFDESGEGKEKLKELESQKNDIQTELNELNKDIDYTIATVIIEAK